MDIYCPACGKKGRIDDGKIPANGIFARCPGCRQRLWISKTEGVSLAADPPAKVPSPDEAPSRHDPAPPESPTSPPAQTSQPRPPSAPDGPRPDKESSGKGLPPDQPTDGDQAPGPESGFELTPLTATISEPGKESPSAKTVPGFPCSLCGASFPASDVVRFGDTVVCAECKPRYVQMMRSGITRPGSFSYGGFWIRLVAKLIDGIILAMAQGILITPLFIFLFKSATTAPGKPFMAAFATANILINVLSIALGAAFTTMFIGRYRATPGKMAFGLMVVTPDGGRVSYMRALGRHFAEMVSALTLGIGYIMAGFDSQKRTLHDRICGTRVIRK